MFGICAVSILMAEVIFWFSSFIPFNRKTNKRWYAIDYLYEDERISEFIIDLLILFL
jgi:hypothetical protein